MYMREKILQIKEEIPLYFKEEKVMKRELERGIKWRQKREETTMRDKERANESERERNC